VKRTRTRRAVGRDGALLAATLLVPPGIGQGQLVEEEIMEPFVTHLNPEEMHNNPAFTQAVIVEGNARTIYIGGQDAVDANGQIVGRDLAAQTEQILNNVETILTAAGATLHDVIKWNIFVVEGQDLREGFGVFQQRWGTTAKPPAVTFAFVAGLANPDFLVEIEAIAVTRP
jgi:enamine deaminase RidA (YjgF/YER057c/UK114 family)